MNDLQSEEFLSRLKARLLVSVLVISVIYATVRYIYFKGVDPSHFPLYILNKAFSISGLSFLALSYVNSKTDLLKLGQEDLRKKISRFTGLMGLSLAGIHTILSLIIFNPGYFPKLFEETTMNLQGELTMLFGALGLYLFIIPALAVFPADKKSTGMKKWRKRQRTGYWGLLAVFFHVTVMGYKGWLNIEGWPGYLPPITLLAAIIAVFPLLLRFIKK